MKIYIFILMIVFTCTASAQEETLINGEVESGGFGGPALNVTTIDGENAILIGGHGGWIINHVFVLGGGGYGLVNNVKARVTDSIHQYIDMGYGGLELEYIASSNALLHLSTEILIGAGGVGYKVESTEVVNEAHRMNSFFVLEPSIHVNMNVTRFFRIAAGVSYRYITGLTSAVTTASDLSGPSANLILKFGTF